MENIFVGPKEFPMPPLKTYDMNEDENSIWDNIRSDYSKHRNILEKVQIEKAQSKKQPKPESKVAVDSPKNDSASLNNYDYPCNTQKYDNLHNIEDFSKLDAHLSIRLKTQTDELNNLKRYKASLEQEYSTEKDLMVKYETDIISNDDKVDELEQLIRIETEENKKQEELAIREKQYFTEYSIKLNDKKRLFENVVSTLQQEKSDLNKQILEYKDELENIEQQQEEVSSLVGMTLKSLSPQTLDYENYTMLTEITSERNTNADDLQAIGHKLNIINIEGSDIDAQSIDNRLSESNIPTKKTNIDIVCVRDMLNSIHRNLKYGDTQRS